MGLLFCKWNQDDEPAIKFGQPDEYDPNHPFYIDLKRKGATPIQITPTHKVTARNHGHAYDIGQQIEVYETHEITDGKWCCPSCKSTTMFLCRSAEGWSFALGDCELISIKCNSCGGKELDKNNKCAYCGNNL